LLVAILTLFAVLAPTGASSQDAAGDAAWETRWRLDVKVLAEDSGPPTVVTSLENVSSKPQIIGLEVNYRMFAFEIVREDGLKYSTPKMAQFPRGSVAPSNKIAPGGKFEEEFLITDLVRDIKPGRYWIRLTRVETMLRIYLAQKNGERIVGVDSEWVEFTMP
jgi:hypothetical protein